MLQKFNYNFNAISEKQILEMIREVKDQNKDLDDAANYP